MRKKKIIMLLEFAGEEKHLGAVLEILIHLLAQSDILLIIIQLFTKQNIIIIECANSSKLFRSYRLFISRIYQAITVL